MTHRLVILLVGIVFIVSCHEGSNGNRTKGRTFSYTDDYGRNVAVPERPLRIVSTSPSVTEIIFALGAGDLLVGRTDFCTYPPQTAAIASIGGISNLNIEKILSLTPDLVISGSMVSKKHTQHLDAMQVPVVCVIEKQRFSGLYDNIGAIGRLIGRTAEADSLIALLQSQIDTALLSEPAGNLPTLYYVVGFGAAGNFTAGGDTYINDILRLGGGHNLAEEVKGWSFSLESLLDADPDYVVIRSEDAARFATTPPYDRLSAVKQQHIIAIESGTIDGQGPRNIEAVKTIARGIAKG